MTASTTAERLPYGLGQVCLLERTGRNHSEAGSPAIVIALAFGLVGDAQHLDRASEFLGVEVSPAVRVAVG